MGHRRSQGRTGLGAARVRPRGPAPTGRALQRLSRTLWSWGKAAEVEYHSHRPPRLSRALKPPDPGSCTGVGPSGPQDPFRSASVTETWVGLDHPVQVFQSTSLRDPGALDRRRIAVRPARPALEKVPHTFLELRTGGDGGPPALGLGGTRSEGLRAGRNGVSRGGFVGPMEQAGGPSLRIHGPRRPRTDA